MPAASDILQFMRSQLFEEPILPTTSLTGKTVVITGANTGLGFQCAKQVANLHASTIILGCRNLTKGEDAKRDILASCKTSPTAIHVWQVDMASYASVEAFAKIKTELRHLDVPVANAGISTNEYRLAENFESTLTVNVVSTFKLGFLVLPQLRCTAMETKQATHLTIVGSNVHCFADHTQLQSPPRGEILSTLSDKSQADMRARYFLSKLLVMQCVRELAMALSQSDQQVIVNCVSPGWCKTGLFRQDDGGFMGRNMLRLIGRTSEVGARCLISAIVAGPDSHGQYLSECRVKRPSVFVRSLEGQDLQRSYFLLEEQRVVQELCSKKRCRAESVTLMTIRERLRIHHA